jgi:AcrR family transcriptional regulator
MTSVPPDVTASQIRCIVYCSRSRSTWTSEDIDGLADAAQRKNRTLGVTGRLLHLPGAFVQALEGPPEPVVGLYRSIEADPRHEQVTLLLDTPLAERAYPHWTMDVVAADDHESSQARTAEDMLRRLLDPAPGAPASRQDIKRLLQGVSRPFMDMTMRATPVQPRALETVERILTTGRALGLRNGGRLPPLHQVANAAGMGLSALYRYFSTPGDVVRMLVRLWVVAQIDRFRATLQTARFASEADVADHVVQAIGRLLLNDMNEPGVPGRIRHRMARDYHNVAFEELWALAGDVRAAMTRDGLDTSDPEGHDRLALAFAGAAAVIKMCVLHAPGMRQSDYFQVALRDLFMGALVGARRDAADDRHGLRVVGG